MSPVFSAGIGLATFAGLKYIFNASSPFCIILAGVAAIVAYEAAAGGSLKQPTLTIPSL